MIPMRAEIALLLVCAAFGSTVAAAAATRRLMIRIAAVLGGVLLIVVLSVYAYGQSHYLFNPIVPAVSLLIAFLQCTWSTRVRRSHGTI